MRDRYTEMYDARNTKESRRVCDRPMKSWTYECTLWSGRPVRDLGIQGALADVLGQIVLRHHHRRHIQVLMEPYRHAAHD